MQISKRTLKMGEPALLKYYPLVEEAKQKGRKVYFLNIGQPDIKTPSAFIETVCNYQPMVVSYQAPEGLLELRRAAGSYYQRLGLAYTENDIFITNGGSEALLFTFLSICDPGDEILTPEPLYSIYKEIAAAANVKLVGIKTFAEDGFSLPDMEMIEPLISAKTRAILITNPGNPTGKVFTKDEINTLSALSKKYGLYFVSDEVYREFLYENLTYQSPAQKADVLGQVVLVDSISKRYSACGARIGFVITKNMELKQSIKKLCQMRLSVSEIDQVGAVNLMELQEDFFSSILKEYSSRREIVFEGLKKIPGVICKMPKGAFYFMVKLPLKRTAHFIEWMIRDFSYKNETILLSPANDFYLNPKDGEDEVRLAYVLNAEDMKKGMLILEKGLEAYKMIFPEEFK
ncbi:pyridoxal phosphate-dependent aminotransferase [Eubacteriaceae bacterium ES3]|nr:pyridoxal phosphate-dependent aminotransferase [Eubacteriaceae bacterium ES3]